jgi:DNA polymerase III subunit gamma/tau
MTYLALARKYRPSTFDDIIGQEALVRTLKNAIELNRVHHAFLFTGVRGVGKTTTARVLARALNCEKGSTATPCGACASCVEILTGTSPDIIEIDGASNTGVDNIRDLRESARYVPSKSRFKIYIIDEVHMLSQAAFNALLKILEEPPAHIKFIFATTEVQKIPITILSRCQRFDLRRMSHAVLLQHLQNVLQQEHVVLGDKALSGIVREAEGSVRDALSLLDQVLSYAGVNPSDEVVHAALGLIDHQQITALFVAVLQKDATTLLQNIDALDAQGHDLSDVTEYLLEHVRDIVVGMLTQGTKQGDYSTSDLQRMFALLMDVSQDVSRSLQPKITLEMGLLRLFEVEPTVKIVQLIERLDTLLQGKPIVAIAQPKVEPRKLKVDHSHWQKVVDAIREKRPSVAAVWEQAKLLEISPEKIALGFDNEFFLASARDKNNMAYLSAAILQVYGQTIEVGLQSSSAEIKLAKSLAEIQAEQAQVQTQKVFDDAREHPAVRDTLDIFGGELKNVVPLS